MPQALPPLVQRTSPRRDPIRTARVDLEPPVSLLLVDDLPANLVALEAVLADDGHEVVTARSGREALKHLLRREFAAILLDVAMPEMDGFELAALIRKRPQTRHTPIVFLTAVGKSEEHIARGYAAGAVDYLFKPFVPEILRAKVAALADLHRKTEAVRRQGERLRDLERREAEARVVAAERRAAEEAVRQELRTARRIQEALLPGGPPHVPGFDVAGRAVPAGDTGGDYFDFLPRTDGTVDLVVGDVCGHGVGPALLMTTTRAYIRAWGLSGEALERVVELTNRALAADVRDGRFVTLFHARLDPGRRVLRHVSAGHTPAVVLRRDGSIKAKLQSTALPLGILPEGRFPADREISLEPGDLLLAYTDGLIEARSACGEQFGLERAIRVAAASRAAGAEGVLDALEAAVRSFTGDRPLEDDLTALVAIAS